MIVRCVSGLFPLAFNSAIHGVVEPLGMRKHARGIGCGLQDEMLKTGRCFIAGNAERILHEPVGYRPKSVVIEGVHAVIAAKSVFLGVGIEAFPNGCCALCDGIKP